MLNTWGQSLSFHNPCIIRSGQVKFCQPVHSYVCSVDSSHRTYTLLLHKTWISNIVEASCIFTLLPVCWTDLLRYSEIVRERNNLLTTVHKCKPFCYPMQYEINMSFLCQWKTNNTCLGLDHVTLSFNKLVKKKINTSELEKILLIDKRHTRKFIQSCI